MVYSKEFLKTIQEITGSPDLSDEVVTCSPTTRCGMKTICEWNAIRDFIVRLSGSRAIGFLLFMTPESEEWEEADGGYLELYPDSEGDKTCGSSTI
eukprot:753837-Hanusia_phi.AAC.2